jgi:hypothetical protein
MVKIDIKNQTQQTFVEQGVYALRKSCIAQPSQSITDQLSSVS